MTPEQALTALLALLAPFNTDLDSLEALAPAVRNNDAQAITDYLALIAQVWPAGIGEESNISNLQIATVGFVDTFWTRLHQAKQLGVSVGYQP